MMNQDNPYAMNQTCKVCGEPAAGFHFGAFTCEGCKSFFGRSYNNLTSISECKNNNECVINKKNRTACKACRLRKCISVGMSKSGSRYGRRSNWFKIHCLLQEQQQQAAAAMAAHNNAQQHGAHMLGGQKPPPHGSLGVPPPSAAAAALGMLGHAGGYPGLYQARTKEELMMLGMEEYAKHAVGSPSVSSPESHNSDSSVEVNVRNNALLHFSGAGGGGGASKHPATSDAPTTTTSAASVPQLRKDLPPFLPLHFPSLASMPVMPPPTFLPPSHLLFPGYHPALYQHHQGLLKPSPEQQQAAAAAAAVQHLFNSNAQPNRFTPTLPLPKLNDATAAQSPKSDALNNNHIPNGSKVAEEFTKRCYLDAVLKYQRHSPPPVATKLPSHPKHDHSISALVTPNSESGRERLKSRHSENDNVDDGAEEEQLEAEHEDDIEVNSNDNDSDCGDELVVSMTPPRSPASTQPAEANKSISNAVSNAATHEGSASAPAPVVPKGQDNPIDLSMKASSSVASSMSSKSSSKGSTLVAETENGNEARAKCDEDEDEGEGEVSHDEDDELQVDDEDNSTLETIKTTIHANNKNGNNKSDQSNSSSHHQHDSNKELNSTSLIDSDDSQTTLDGIKRKLDALVRKEAESGSCDNKNDYKRAKLEVDAMEKVCNKITAAAALDLTTRI